jgi:PAS domain S-box-containing protein
LPTSLRDERNEDYASVLSSILDASTEYSIVATDLAGTFLLWNEGARRIYGYAPEEVMGRNLRMLHSPTEVGPRTVDAICAAALLSSPWEGVVMRVRKSGRTFPARLVLTVRRDRAGQPIGFLSISKDISDELELNRRLLDSEKYNRVLIESTIDGLFTTDLKGVITDVNRTMEQVTGVPREKLIGTRFREYVTPPSDGDEAVRRMLAEQHVTDLELSVRLPDGNVREYSFNASPLGEDPAGIRGFIATVRDVGEQRRLREALEERNHQLEIQNERVREANRLKSEFLASMSHELRTPLNSIIGFSDFLLTGEEDRLAPDQREYLTDILNSGNHLLSLINDILDLAKVESGKLELSPISLILQEAIDGVCSSLRPQFMERQLDLIVDVDPHVQQAVLDPVRFKQILYNLLSNAVKFTPRGGRVEVTVTKSGSSHFAVRVSDTGIGIPAKDLPRIFREFEQVDSGPGRRYSGTGLGLPLTQKLVTLMSGSIVVSSEVGVGTQFTVRLPLAPLPMPGVHPVPQGIRT